MRTRCKKPEPPYVTCTLHSAQAISCRSVGKKHIAVDEYRYHGQFWTAIRNITAPKSFLRKSVFCVDNVDASFTADDVRNFVSKMSVRVVSCFETKPRKRRSDNSSVSSVSSVSTISDRKAFRLCINSDDCELLLNDRKWPAHVTVSKWFFKQPSNIANQSKEGRTSLNLNNTAVPESACSQPPQKLARPDLSNNIDSGDETDMDGTTIVQQSSSTDVPVSLTTRD